jgi:hypothetical protein
MNRFFESERVRAQTEARVKENVCISDDLTSKWRNPPAGEKMEKFKRQLIESREPANIRTPVGFETASVPDFLPRVS